jgi:thioredoxin reductase/NAD-dependent dihydropyrimidine dehydrogenase PreA subunit
MDLWTVIAIGAPVALALALYKLWGWHDRRHTARARARFEDTAALGADAVPQSIHPRIDADVCMGSGACVRACPEKEVLGIVDGRGVLINPLACVGHGACAAACPVEAIDLVFGSAQRGVELPALDASFQTSRPGVYVIGELGGMGLIRNAVTQGRQAAEHVVAGTRRGGGGGVLDALVVGAGPAGLSATLALRAGGLTVELVEREELGVTIRHYPRDKVVMTGSFELAGYGKVGKRTMSKSELVNLWESVHRSTRLPLVTGVTVDALEEGPGPIWTAITSAGPKHAANVLLALGRRGAPRKLGVQGEELEKVVYRVIEPEVFRGRRVLVVGGGNAAAECALSLAESGGCAQVALSYRRRELARLRAQVRERFDALVAARRIDAHLGTEVERIGERDVVLRDAAGKRITLGNDSVVVQIGGVAPSDVLRSFGVETVVKYGEA